MTFSTIVLKKKKKKNTIQPLTHRDTFPTLGIAIHALLQMRGGPDLVVAFIDIIGKLLITSLNWHNILAHDPIFHIVTEVYTSHLI